MIERSVEVFPDFKIYITSLHGRLFVSASVEESGSDVEHIAGEIFVRIAEVLSDFSAQIVHEQCFGSLGIRKHLLKARAQAFISRDIEPGTPLTYIDGEPCSESKNFSGIQIRALKISNDEKVRTILDNGIPRGRAWNQNGAAFFMLHNVDGKNQSDRLQADQQSKYEAMFHEAERLLNAEGASYKDVVRTWIYISDILDWYDDFNAARNYCYTENGLIGKSKTGLQAEQIYLPASTGIEGKNPSSTPAIMDVFAIHRESGSEVKIRPIYGIKQRSAFRYGSAFSRAMVIEEPGVRQILVSGTASIDENGKSVFKGDTEAQIRQTLNVVSALLVDEGATLKDICQATVFLKHKQDFSIFRRVAEEIGIFDLPSVNVEADVCRNELLFELDASFMLEK